MLLVLRFLRWNKGIMLDSLSLQTYINADPSGELGFIMSEEKVQIIVDCFEFIKDESYLSKLLNSSVPESVSSSLFAILSSFQND